MFQNPLLQKTYGAPKVELHIHIEGSLEPELIFKLAERNGVELPFKSVESLRAAYVFTGLQEFLDIYYLGAGVLRTEEDFYDMTKAYTERALADNIVHAEIFFDPQTHTQRGVSVATIVTGMERALREADARGLSSRIIPCFLRHLSEDEALEEFGKLLPFFGHYSHRMVAIGLDSSERGNPPSKFQNLFHKARSLGLNTVAHAGEEGPAAYIYEALDLLKVQRIDHGVRSIDDPALVARLAASGVPLTVCPLSNFRLGVSNDLRKHALRYLLEQGLVVTVNSDDPAYFGGYVNTNYGAIIDGLKLNDAEVGKLIRNGFEASFLDVAVRNEMLANFDAYWQVT
jgi:adenine deaminase